MAKQTGHRVYTFLTSPGNMLEAIAEIPTEDSSLNKLPIRGNDNARTRFVLTKIPRSMEGNRRALCRLHEGLLDGSSISRAPQPDIIRDLLFNFREIHPGSLLSLFFFFSLSLPFFHDDRTKPQ